MAEASKNVVVLPFDPVVYPETPCTVAKPEAFALTSQTHAALPVSEAEPCELPLAQVTICAVAAPVDVPAAEPIVCAIENPGVLAMLEPAAAPLTLKTE